MDDRTERGRQAGTHVVERRGMHVAFDLGRCPGAAWGWRTDRGAVHVAGWESAMLDIDHEAGRFSEFMEWAGGILGMATEGILEIGLSVTLDCIAFEDVFGSGYSTKSLNGYRAILLLIAHRLCVPAISIAPNSLKKFSTGDGRAGKLAMIAHAQSLIGKSEELNDAEGDAVCILGWALTAGSP